MRIRIEEVIDDKVDAYIVADDELDATVEECTGLIRSGEIDSYSVVREES